MATTPILFNGSDLLFFIGSQPVAMSRTCSISIKTNMVDTTTKDSVGGWAESLPVGKSWTGKVDGLVVWGNVEQFSDAIIDRTLLQISFKKRDSVAGDPVYSGSAWIESFDMDAGQDAAVTYSIAFTGCGALSSTTSA